MTGALQPGVENPTTVADGLLVGMGALPFQILSEHGVEIIRVGEAGIIEAASFFLERMKLVVEPSGATALAALVGDRERFAGRRIGMIVSGGNTDLSSISISIFSSFSKQRARVGPMLPTFIPNCSAIVS